MIVRKKSILLALLLVSVVALLVIEAVEDRVTTRARPTPALSPVVLGATSEPVEVLLVPENDAGGITVSNIGVSGLSGTYSWQLLNGGTSSGGLRIEITDVVFAENGCNSVESQVDGSCDPEDPGELEGVVRLTPVVVVPGQVRAPLGTFALTSQINRVMQNRWRRFFNLPQNRSLVVLDPGESVIFELEWSTPPERLLNQMQSDSASFSVRFILTERK